MGFCDVGLLSHEPGQSSDQLDCRLAKETGVWRSRRVLLDLLTSYTLAQTPCSLLKRLGFLDLGQAERAFPQTCSGGPGARSGKSSPNAR